MSNYYQEQAWKQKSDEEIFRAVEHLDDFDKSVHALIRNEALRRKGLLPVPAEAESIQAPSEPIISHVKVVDFDMPFGSMVKFLVKWTIASIPAMIILLIIGSILGLIFGGIFSAIFRR